MKSTTSIVVTMELGAIVSAFLYFYNIEINKESKSNLNEMPKVQLISQSDNLKKIPITSWYIFNDEKGEMVNSIPDNLGVIILPPCFKKKSTHVSFWILQKNGDLVRVVETVIDLREKNFSKIFLDIIIVKKVKFITNTNKNEH